MLKVLVLCPQADDAVLDRLQADFSAFGITDFPQTRSFEQAKELLARQAFDLLLVRVRPEELRKHRHWFRAAPVEMSLALLTHAELPSFESPTSHLQACELGEGAQEFLVLHRQIDDYLRGRESFVAIRTSELALRQPLLFDLYLKVTPVKFVKRYQQGDVLDEQDLASHLRLKKTEFFFIRREDAEKLLDVQSEDTDRILRQDPLDPERARKALNENLAVIQDVVARLGFSESVQKLAHKSVEVMLKSIGSTPDLTQALKTLKKYEGKYLSSHCFMLAEISCAIALLSDLQSKNQSQSFLKLTLASFMHDISLKDPVLAQYATLEEVERAGGYSPQEIHQFAVHPIAAAELVRAMKSMPPDLDKILLEHHERPDGSGFPRHLNSEQILPLSAIFILSHDLLSFMLGNVPPSDRGTWVEAFLRRKGSQYRAAPFAAVTAALENSISVS